MESLTHMNLVKRMKEWIAAKFDLDPFFILDALPSERYTNKAPRLPGGEPDLFYQSPESKFLVIGEAKTAKDIETPHSIKQYKAYLAFCENFDGECHVILSVPSEYKAGANNLLNRLFEHAKKTKHQTLGF